MKKILYFILVIVFVFGFAACGNDLPETAAVQDQVVQETDASDADSGNGDSGSDTLDPLEGEHIIPNGEYVCYDRFSGEHVGNAWIKVHDSNSSQVVLSYVSPAGNWGPVTVNVDGSGHGSVTVAGSYSEVTLDMTFSGSVISVDEIEGMGAMAYEFRHQ